MKLVQHSAIIEFILKIDSLCVRIYRSLPHRFHIHSKKCYLDFMATSVACFTEKINYCFT